MSPEHSGFYPESAENDPNAPWLDESPDYWCDHCEWDSNDKKESAPYEDIMGDLHCPICGEAIEQ